jgi:hypothetical protein
VTWIRRVFGDGSDAADGGDDAANAGSPADDDSPDALRRRLWDLVQFVNASAGRLPVDAVVAAREVADTVARVIDTSADRDLDIYAVVQINGIVGDYLPTTLRSYLSLDPSLTDQPAPSGRTPRVGLREQLADLQRAADDLLTAAQAHDVDSLFSQGNFLRTKYSRSDLDL